VVNLQINLGLFIIERDYGFDLDTEVIFLLIHAMSLEKKFLHIAEGI